jgi:hypothetical protein
MQPVGADDQADVARWGTIELDAGAVTLLLDPRDLVAEQCLDRAVQRIVDCC